MTESKDDLKENKITTTIRMPASLHQQMSAEVLRRKYTPEKTSIDALVRDALIVYLDQSGRAKIPHNEGSGLLEHPVPETLSITDGTVIQLTPDEIPWVEKLLKVLRSGDSDFVSAVTSNLLVFATYCELGRVRDHGPGSADPGEAPAAPPAGSSTQPAGKTPDGAKDNLRERVNRARKKNNRRIESRKRDKLG